MRLSTLVRPDFGAIDSNDGAAPLVKYNTINLFKKKPKKKKKKKKKIFQKKT